MPDHLVISGSGNTFTVSDNRDNHIPNIMEYTKEHAVKAGLDGSLFIEKSDKADFKMRIINSDGSEAEMCGNGARCAALFAYDQKVISSRIMSFETIAGIIEGEVKEGNRVRVQLTQPKDYRESVAVTTQNFSGSVQFINTGVPHAVVFRDDIETVDVTTLGREIRRSEAFKPAGTNVNFVKVLDQHTIRVRTYERGVEGETQACGTGSTASALVTAALGKTTSPVTVKTQGGEELVITFQQNGTSFQNACLEGVVTYLKSKGGS